MVGKKRRLGRNTYCTFSSEEPTTRLTNIWREAYICVMLQTGLVSCSEQKSTSLDIDGFVYSGRFLAGCCQLLRSVFDFRL